MSRVRLHTTVLASLAVLACGVPVSAQEYTGRIDVLVRDAARAAPLARVALETEGPRVATAITDRRGEAHFVDLAPGEYVVIAKLRGFNDYRSINVHVSAGTTVPLQIGMSTAGIARQVDARIDAPRVDPRARTSSIAVEEVELQTAPWPGDPWSVLQSVDGVVVDRENVAGEESGQQSVFEAKGAAKGDNVWNLDGIPITDMAAPGSSSVYLDSGTIRELRVTTGGASPAIATAGVQVDVVLPEGSDRWRGSGRANFGSHTWQGHNITARARTTLASYSRAGDYSDVGAEAGGPVLKRRVFVWGSAGRTQPERRILVTGASADQDAVFGRDKTTLQTYAVKATAEIDPRTRVQFTVFRNDKTETGRGASAVDIHATPFDQEGPATIYRAGIQRRFGANLFIDARAAHIANTFHLTNHITQFSFTDHRPQTSVLADGYSFVGRHEVAFGLQWRRAKETLTDRPAAAGDYWSGYASDTIVSGRRTIALAARWDRARSAALGREVVWNSVTPRAAFTYVLDDNRTTVMRGTYAMLPSQLGASLVASVLAPSPFGTSGNFHGFPGGGSIGDYRTPFTHEVSGGVEHQLPDAVVLSALVTWRRMTNANWVHVAGITGSDYALVAHLTGSAGPIREFDVPVYAIGTDAVPRDVVDVFEARPGYHQRYWGLDVGAKKRFSDNWMLRLAFSANDGREYFDSIDAMADPTPTLESPNRNGGAVLDYSNVSHTGNVYMVLPRYQFSGTAYYQVRFGIELAASYALRQGFASPFYRSGVAPDALAPDGKNVLIVPGAGTARLSPAHTLDGRISREFTRGRVRAATAHLDLDAFNLLNRGIVLERVYDLSRPDFNGPRRIMNPRTARIGVRVTF